MMKLKKIEYKIKGRFINGFSRIKVAQKFINVSDEVLEAQVSLPVTDKATIIGFYGSLNGKEFHTKMMEKEKANETYKNNFKKGNNVGRADLFSEDGVVIDLGNLYPNDYIEMTIEYLIESKMVDSTYELIIPTTIAPRYKNPSDTKKYHEPKYILNDNIKADFELEIISQDYRVKNAVIDGVKYITEDNLVLKKENIKLSRDLKVILEVEMTDNKSLIYEKISDNEHYYSLRISPEFKSIEKLGNRDFMFLIDISGSMHGVKIEEAKRALKLCIRNIEPGNRFNIIAFESIPHFLFEGFVDYNEKTFNQADEWIELLEAMGGTEIYSALEATIGDLNSNVIEIFMITDGQVYDTESIYNLIRESYNRFRIFTFGIDTAVNMSFLNGISDRTSARAEYIQPGEEIEGKIMRQFARLDSPFITDIVIKNQDFKIDKPQIESNNFNFDSYAYTFKTKKEIILPLEIEIYSDEQMILFEIDKVYKMNELYKENECILKTALLKNSLDKLIAEYNGNVDQIVEMSIASNILTDYTTLIYVIENDLNNLGEVTSIKVPLNYPDKWKMGSSDLHCDDFILAESALSHYQIKPRDNQSKATRHFQIKRSNKQLESIDLDSEDKRIKELLLEQNFDGSFGNFKTNNVDKLKYSIECLIKIIKSIENDNYIRQIQKAYSYIIKAIKDYSVGEEYPLIESISEYIYYAGVEKGIKKLEEISDIEKDVYISYEEELEFYEEKIYEEFNRVEKKIKSVFYNQFVLKY